MSVMVRGLMERVLAPEQINRIFSENAKIQYTRELMFSSLVELMSLVVCGIHPSVNAAYRAKAKQLNVSRTAVYSGLRSDAQVGRGYAPLGHTPVIQPSTQRVRINYVASISNQGKVRFMLYTQKLTAQVFITFLQRLIAQRTRKLMWIVDRHPVHRSEAVQQWLHEHQEKIEMHLLPPYSPQLKPAEYLNCNRQARCSLPATDP